jgi:NAD(P)-dependent dehydrogenase (short-subunit alcohol dehydrogenase family)
MTTLEENAARGAILVTGAGQRLGKTIATALATAGYAVAIHYGHSVEKAEQTVAEIRAAGGKAAAFGADLSVEAEVESLLGRVAKTLAEPFAVINSASTFDFDDAATLTYARLEALNRVNLGAPLVLARSLHQRIAAHVTSPDTAGVVVNLLDQKLFNPNPDYLSYTLSKAGLHCATTLLAQALAPSVRVVGIAPGITLPSGGQSQDEFEAAHRKTPLGRSSRPEDIAKAVLFAIENPAITGSTLIVDGGQHLTPTPRDVMFLAS